MSPGSILREPERPRVTIRHDVFPLDGLPDAAGGRTEAHVAMVEIAVGGRRGRGEAVPQPCFGETIESVVAALEAVAPAVETGMLTRRGIQRRLPPGAARNALDLALWDFDAKRTGCSVWQAVGLDLPHRVTTAYAIPRGTPAAMASAAAEQAHRPLLKLYLGADGDAERLAAVRGAAPACRLIVDAGGGWSAAAFQALLPQLEAAGVELIEQPVAAGADADLARIRRRMAVSAGEACRTEADIETLAGRYDAVTINLDRAGGLTSALEWLDRARGAELRVVIKASLATSLGVAPAVLLAQDADWIELDAPLHLVRDRQPGLRYDGSIIYPPSTGLWG